jgi:flagellar motor switch protein FliN
MSSAGTAPALHPFIEAIRKAICDVFSKTFGSDWTVEITERRQTNEEAAAVWFGFLLSGDVQGEAALQISLHDAGLLANKFVADPEKSKADFDVTDKQVVQEILQQVLSSAAANLKEQFGQITSKVIAIGPPAWDGLTIFLYVAGGLWGGSSLQLRLNNELVAAMSPKPATASAVPAVESAPTTLVPTAHEERVSIATEIQELYWDVDLKEGLASISGKDFDLLRKTDLQLRMRFGTRTLTLKDVLGLSSGSIIKLDREVQAPADLMLGEKIVGRGEVVIVDGNFGVRVTEVASARQQRDGAAGL